MLRRIKLYGALAKFVGQRVLEADVATAAEAVRFLLANWPALEQHMADQHYSVRVGTYALGEDELHDPAGQQEISISPVIAGAGTVGRIILGAALIAGAFFTGGATIGLFGLAAPLSLSSTLLTIGASMVLTGAAQLLTPFRVSMSALDPTVRRIRAAPSTSGIQQTSRRGVPVPIAYGKVLVGSVVISAGVDTVQVRA